MKKYLLVNLLGPGPRLLKKRIYRPAISQRLRITGLKVSHDHFISTFFFIPYQPLPQNHSLTFPFSTHTISNKTM